MQDNTFMLPPYFFLGPAVPPDSSPRLVKSLHITLSSWEQQ